LPAGRRLKERSHMLAFWTRIVHRNERGQGTVEYFLVILAATALALILFNMFKSDGGGILSTILRVVKSWLGRF